MLSSQFCHAAIISMLVSIGPPASSFSFLSKTPLVPYITAVPPTPTRRWSPNQQLLATKLGKEVLTNPSVGTDDPIPYNWKDNWYPLTYVHHVPDPSKSAEPTAAAVFGQPLVLWRSVDGGPISCADDLCPHRAAALSEGRVRDGRIECLYHGWQFRGVEGEGDLSQAGSCARIPQLKLGGTIPKRACLKMREVRASEGVVWVWMGDENPTFEPSVTGDGLDEYGKKDGWITYKFQIDLPYDHSYLIENLLDPAHIPISHDATAGGGQRDDAQPFEMEIDEDSFSPKGFTGRYRRAGPNADPSAPFNEYRLDAPGILRKKTRRGSAVFGAAMHAIPLGMGRCRLLFMTYFTGLPWIANLIFKLTPEWVRFLGACKVLEQDVGLITTQEDHFARHPDNTMKQDFLLINSSDMFVAAYRRWLDRVGPGMPWFQGLARSSSNKSGHINNAATLTPSLDPANHRASNQNVRETRYHRHVIQSPEAKAVLRKIIKIKKQLLGAATLAISTAAGLAPVVAERVAPRLALYQRLFKILAVSAPLLTLGGALMHSLEQKFYVSFKRRDELVFEKGI